jgi:hypothetical protein
MRFRLRCLGLAAALALLVSCLESSFELAPDSRIPNWFHLPKGIPRSAVSVTMDDYIDSSGRWARFTLKITGGIALATVDGTMRGDQPQGPNGNLEVVTVNGITDIVEHRMTGPVFYMTDDPDIWKALGLQVGRKAD